MKYSGRLTLIRERDSRYVRYRRGRTFYEIYIGRAIDARERDREYGRTKCEECRVQDNGFTWEQQSRGEVRVLERPRILNDSHPASVQIESRPLKIPINSNYILVSHNIGNNSVIRYVKPRNKSRRLQAFRLFRPIFLFVIFQTL